MHTPPICGLESQVSLSLQFHLYNFPDFTPALLEQVLDVDIPPDGVRNPFVKPEPDIALPHGLSHLALDRLFLGDLRGCGGEKTMSKTCRNS